MPGTPLPGRRSRNSTGALRSHANKENSMPQDELNSPGDIMSKEKRASRVNRRISVLKILGRTESEISPCAEPERETAEAGAKRRRTSRVSFGNIQTAIFEKDSQWNNTPSPAIGHTQVNNLSTLPDDSGFASPAPAEQSCVDMSLTGGFTNRMQPLSSLPPVDDMFQNDTSLASFGEPETSDAPAPAPEEGYGMSLADLVAEDERECAFRANNPPPSNKDMEFRSSSSNQDVDQFQKPADMTDHDLTKDIPTAGFRAEQTGAFLPTSRRGSDVTSAGMELTNAYGGIVHVQRRAEEDAEEEEEEEGGMEFTNAYGGIVAERALPPPAVDGGRRGGGGGGGNNTSADMVELTGTLSRIRRGEKTAEEEEEEGGGRDGVTEGVAMEMTGTFGRILSAISAGAAAEEEGPDGGEEEEEERTDPLAVGTDQRTYVDGEVTMFTPLSRIKRRASSSRPEPAAPAEPEPEAEAEADPVGSTPPASPPARRTRSKSRTPTRAAASEEKERESGRRRSGARGRKSVGGSRKDKDKEGEGVQVPLEAFLEEMGIRFLTHAKTHTRKSSFCAPMRGSEGEEPPTEEKLHAVLITGTERGQLANNASRLRAMSATLVEEVAERERAVSARNPEVVREGMSEDQEVAVRVQQRMKALKKSCRVATEIRWMQWREQAQREVEEALGRVKQAVAQDLEALEAATAATEEGRQEEARSKASARAAELSEQLAGLAEAEGEQAQMLATFGAQRGAEAAAHAALLAQRDLLLQPAPLPADDEMLPAAAEEAPRAAALGELAARFHALHALSLADPAQVAPAGLTLNLPARRALVVALSPGGAVSAATLLDLEAPRARDAMHAALWDAAGCQALVQGLVFPHAAAAAAVAPIADEVALRCRRLEGLELELSTLARSSSVRTGVSQEGVPQVEVVAYNSKKAFKVKLTFALAWHYPSGPLPCTSSLVMGEVEADAVADAALRHCSGPQRISRIVAELSNA